MKITLIKPSIGRMGNRLYIDQGRMEPLQLGVIAALTPNDIEVKLFDDRIDIIDYDEQTDLVVITVETFTAKRAYEIAEEYGQRNNIFPFHLFNSVEAVFTNVISAPRVLIFNISIIAEIVKR